VAYGRIVMTCEHDDSQNAERKHSAARFVSVDKRAVTGSPNMDLVSTSYIERLNATTHGRTNPTIQISRANTSQYCISNPLNQHRTRLG
jgi:hypothetical protein